MSNPPPRRRSVLYVPAANEKAMAKTATLACDAVIFDLEDAVAPAEKPAARDRLGAWFAADTPASTERIIRINGLATEWGAADLEMALASRPDAILLPKVEDPRDVEVVAAKVGGSGPRLWAMIETPRAILGLAALAELGPRGRGLLDCFVTGTNDLVKETGVWPNRDRALLLPWLMQVVLAARAGGMDVLDGVYNDFRDAEGFAAECAAAAAMGFDGKTLIHPAQIEEANRAFSPSAEAVADARAVVEAFALPENSGKGVISVDGRMVERLHLSMAERLLTRAGAYDAKNQ